MPQTEPNTEQLDLHLLEVVRALHGAVKQGLSHQNDPKILENAIADCEEILDVIMAGKVDEWLN